MTVDVYLTVDVEVWPVGAAGWPHVPLRADQGCRREVSAYFDGASGAGSFGLPYQLDMLTRHGLHATFFVDPMFSLALGIEPLRRIVQMIQSNGQRVELHLHPEWLTDPRCQGLPQFRGPLIGSYPPDVQERLLAIASDRLVEAGAAPTRAFRAGSWGASVSTLRALAKHGIAVDASLNAHYPSSLPDLSRRASLQRPTRIEGIVELPVTRFDDGVTPGGRPLSLVGVSFAETRHVLEKLEAQDEPTAVIVMHSNEFAKTERLRAGAAPTPRRTVIRRFERLCRYLSAHADRFPTRFVADHHLPREAGVSASLPIASNRSRTFLRLMEQVISRWY